jgi:FkbM family methyltransferase
MTQRALTPLPLGFHGDRHLLQLVDHLVQGVDLFLETGSNTGSTLGYVARRFPQLDCLSCEPDPEAFRTAEAHALTRPGVRLLPLTSQAFLSELPQLQPDLPSRRPLAWLDAHGYGYEWPLREEIEVLTRLVPRGLLLIDDFEVPGATEFEWDSYAGQVCNFGYIANHIAPQVAYRLFYPAYREHTSPWHGLRGWGLIAFAPSLAEIERLDLHYPELCRQAVASEPLLVPNRAFDLEAELEGLLRHLEKHPLDPDLLNASATLEARLGRTQRALERLGQALNSEPEHADARANLSAILEANRGLPGKRQAVAAGPSGPAVARDPYRDLVQLLDVPQPTIVDGGANRGHTVAKFLELFPEAQIHAFEPLPDLALALRQRFPKAGRLHVHQAALAAEPALLSLERLANDEATSLLPTSALNQHIHGEKLFPAKRLAVPAVPLSHAVSAPIDLLKLDLQGYELEALRGLGERLAEVRLIFTEVEYVPLYEGQPLFADIDQFLRQAGFRLFHLYSTWCHPSGQITSGDALYVNQRYFS